MEEDKIISSYELVKLLEAEKDKVNETFFTGWEDFDLMTKGIRAGDVVTISGLSGHGKSQFAISMLKKLSEQRIYSVYFSFELSNYEVIERFNGDIPLFYLPELPTDSAPAWIFKKTKEAMENYEGVRFIFIDHLHYLTNTSLNYNANKSAIIGDMVRKFKMMARQLNVVVVLLCHVRRLTDREGRPTMDDLRDSSDIANESSLVLLLHRKGKKRRVKKKGEEEDEEEIPLANDAWLYIDKVRRHGGQTGRIKFTLNENGFYEETA